ALPLLFENDPLYAIPRPESVQLFIQVKSNGHIVDYEDACAISEDKARFALCDGVSSSSLPRPWATLLAQRWLYMPFYRNDPTIIEQWLAQPRQKWEEWVKRVWEPTINNRNRMSGQKPLLPDTVREVLQRGASSTFLGLILDRQKLQWRATAIGDTCLFV